MGCAKPLKKIEVEGSQPMKMLLVGMYCESTNENASSGQPCVYVITKAKVTIKIT